MEEPEKAREEERLEDKDEDIQALRRRFGDRIESVRLHREQLSFTLSPESLCEVGEFLRDSRGFGLLSFVAGVDCLELPVSYRFKATYSLLDLERAKRIRLEVPCEDDLEPHLPSVREIWPGADKHECEAFDLVGIVFDGNSELERILTPDDFEGHPHRKDFDISAEPVEFSFRETPEGKPEATE
jgi:NADH-quinone oxidoreductase subunit C